MNVVHQRIGVENLERLAVPRDRIKTKIVKARGVVRAILKEAEDYDLVVIGCTREPLLYRIVKQTLPETVAKLCPKPFVMVNSSSAGIASWVRRWV